MKTLGFIKLDHFKMFSKYHYHNNMNIQNVFLPSVVSALIDCKVANLLDPQFAHVFLTLFLVERLLQM